MESELPLNDDRRALRPGTKAWRLQERVRYLEGIWKYDGVFPPWLTAIQLGVSRQRVHQLMQAGVLERLEYFGHTFFRGDEIDALVALEKDRRTGAWRLSPKEA